MTKLDTTCPDCGHRLYGDAERGLINVTLSPGSSPQYIAGSVDVYVGCPFGHRFRVMAMTCPANRPREYELETLAEDQL